MAAEVKRQGYPMVLNFVLHRQNIDQVEQILELSLELGADYVELANTQYYGWALHNRAQLLPSLEQLKSRSHHPSLPAKVGDKMKIILWCRIITKPARRPA